MRKRPELTLPPAGNRNPRMRLRIRSALSFALKNFATPIVFYVMFEEIGIKAAIAFAVGVAMLQTLAHLIFRWRFSLFFILATTFTVLFGGMDLLITTPRFFRLEPFAQNFCVGVVFLVTLATRHSMVYRLAMSIPHEFRPDLIQEGESYLTRLTLVWAAYFFIKAFAFLYLAFRVNLGQLYVLRVLLGSGSALILFFGEILYRRFRSRT